MRLDFWSISGRTGTSFSDVFGHQKRFLRKIRFLKLFLRFSKCVVFPDRFCHESSGARTHFLRLLRRSRTILAPKRHQKCFISAPGWQVFSDPFCVFLGFYVGMSLSVKRCNPPTLAIGHLTMWRFNRFSVHSWTFYGDPRKVLYVLHVASPVPWRLLCPIRSLVRN